VPGHTGSHSKSRPTPSVGSKRTDAVIIGVLLLTVAARDGRRFWHVLAASGHTLLGTANLVVWHSFVVFGMVPMGIAATVVHFVFVVAHIGAVVVSRERTSAQPLPDTIVCRTDIIC